MKAIQNYEDIENLKADDKLVELWNGDANYYRFLCFHPRNRNYVILLNFCEQPVRRFCPDMFGKFYTEYTHRDILEYKQNFAKSQVDELERALAKLEDKK